MDKPNPNRRQFLRHLALGTTAVATAAGMSGCDDSITISFPQGVASGDPLANAVLLWTRAYPSEDSTVSVTWEVASDAAFSAPLASGAVTTSAARDYTVKVDVTGLLPGRTYYYRFKAGASQSVVGRTRTLPAGATNQVKLAVFSCPNHPAGYFHVYAEAAKRDDLDAVLHLGDYIYEYGMGEYATEDAAALGRVPVPAHELYSLADYRARYAQYRGDADLQALHARAPFICVWDDHEVANDAYTDGAENHNPGEGDYIARRAAAAQAWYEWLPVREQDAANPLITYRSFNFGDLLSLHMLDTRHIGRDRQLDYADYFDPSSGAFDSTAFTNDMGNPARQLLGQTQVNWLNARLTGSSATWQVLGQQVLMGRMYLPSPLLTPDPQHPSVTFAEYGVIATAFVTYQTLAAQLTAAGTPVTPANLIAAGMTAEQLAIVNDPAQQAIIGAPSIPYNLDAWDGYAVARETVFGMARGLDKNLVVLSGDTHNAWANNLQDLSGNAVGVEFACSSVSSPGLEEYLPGTPPAELAAGVMQLIPTLKYADTARRGYTLVTLSHAEARADWYFVDTVKATAYTPSLDKSLKTLPGAANRVLLAV